MMVHDYPSLSSKSSVCLYHLNTPLLELAIFSKTDFYAVFYFYENSSRALNTAIGDEDHGVVDINTCPTPVDISIESASIDISTDSVEFDTSIIIKKIGLCNVDVKQFYLATTEKRVRPIDMTYMQNIVRTLNVD